MPDRTTARVGEQRPGGRAARVRTDVLNATTELLETVGYEGLSVDEVAANAGVHKTTIYRRWPTKSELVTDAIRALSAEAVPVPDTGTLAEDLQELANQVVKNIGSEAGGRRSRSLVAAATTSDEMAAQMHQFWTERLELTGTIVDRAIDRGELPKDADRNLIIETLIGPLWVRLLLTGRPINRSLADDVATIVAAGAGAVGDQT